MGDVQESQPAAAREARHFGAPQRSNKGVEANARLTSSTAVVLLVLLAVEGFTVLSVRSMIQPHVFIGVLLIPPVLLKIGSTTYRFFRYYSGSPEYRRKGPPHPLLRVLGPLLVMSSVVVLASGVALLFVGPGLRQNMMLLHKVSFVLWFGVMTIHVLGHILETAKIAPQDFYARTRRQVKGAGLRQWGIATSILVGLLLGWMSLGHINHFLAG
jgi:hypothetical protein